MTRIDHAIARSVSHNEIVRVADATEGDLDDVRVLAEDMIEVEPGFYDAWGTDDNGESWRIEVRTILDND